jgi:hypothetical protein
LVQIEEDVATPANGIPVSPVALTGVVYIDALLYDAKWSGALGAGATLQYSFPWVDGAAAYWSLDALTGYGASTGDGEP